MPKETSDFNMVYEKIKQLAGNKKALFSFLNTVSWCEVLRENASNNLAELFEYFESQELQKAAPVVLKAMLTDVFKQNPKLLNNASYFESFFGNLQLPIEKRLSNELKAICDSNQIRQDDLAAVIIQAPRGSCLRNALEKGRLLSSGGVPTFPHNTALKLGV